MFDVVERNKEIIKLYLSGKGKFYIIKEGVTIFIEGYTKCVYLTKPTKVIFSYKEHPRFGKLRQCDLSEDWLKALEDKGYGGYIFQDILDEYKKECLKKLNNRRIN